MKDIPKVTGNSLQRANLLNEVPVPSGECFSDSPCLHAVLGGFRFREVLAGPTSSSTITQLGPPNHTMYDIWEYSRTALYLDPLG